MTHQQNTSMWHPKCILLSGIPRDYTSLPATLDTIRCYFEDNNLSGGGAVCENGIQVTSCKQDVLVEFELYTDAAEVIKQAPHRVMIGDLDCQLHVLRCPLTVYNKYYIQGQNDEHSESSEFVPKIRPIDVDSHQTRQGEKSPQLSIKENTDNLHPSLETKPHTDAEKEFQPTTQKDAVFAKERRVERKLPLDRDEGDGKDKRDDEIKLSTERGGISSVMESADDERKLSLDWDREDKSEGNIAKDQEDDCELSRTLVVEGITNDLDIEDLELYFESEKTCGGGSLQTINFEENSGMASLVFDRALAVENILSREEHVIDGHSVTVKPYQPPRKEQDDADAPITKILITGIKPGTSGEMLQLLFENEKKSGGGEIQSFEMDKEGGASAVLVYVDDKVSERVLAKKTVIFKGTEMTVTQLVEEAAAEQEELIWDKRTVYVTGFAAMSADALELLYENQKKSGGGPVEAVVMVENADGEKAAFVTFENEADAARALDLGKVTRRDGSVVKCTTPDQQQLTLLPTNQNTSQTNDTSNNRFGKNPVANNSISVSGLDDSVTDDMLEMLFEDEGRFGGGAIESLAIDPESGMASITFEKDKVAQRLLSKGAISYKNLELHIQPLQLQRSSAKSHDNSTKGALSLQSTEKSCSRSIEVFGFGDGITTEYLQMFFSSSKSCGGGEIEHIDYDQESKKAIIKFKHESTVESVLSRHQQKTLCIGKCEITIHPLNNKLQGALSLPSTEKSCLRSIEVLGFADDITTEYLHFFFSSSKPCNGGEIENIDHDKEKKKAIIMFKQETTVESVLNRHQQKPLCIGKREITILPLNKKTQIKTPQHRTSMWGETKKVASKTCDKTKETATVKEKDSDVLNGIEVTGIKPGTPTDFVQLFFENNKKSGGGGIESLNHNSEQGAAVITFKDKATCKSVINRHKETPIYLEARRLQIQELDPSLFGGTLPGINSCAIQVSGFAINTSDEGIVMYFENRRMSGGGDVQEIVHKVQDGIAVITFKSSEVAGRVVEKHRSDPLRYDDTPLQVKMLCSNSRPSQVAGEKADHLLFFKNVGLDTDPEDIGRYLELLPRCQVQRCVFGIKAGTVLVEFVTAPGYEEFYKLACQKPLKGNMVDVQSVAKSREIEVYGITGLSSQKLQMYFEHHKSNGGEVEKVEILSEENCAIVTFVEFGVAEKVLSKTNHTLEQKKLQVKQHYRCIGILPLDHDHTSATTSAAVQTLIRQIDPDILNFIMCTETNRKGIETGVGEAGGRVVWPGEEVYEDAEVAVECLLKREDHNYAEKVKTWEDEIQSECCRLLSGFITDHVNILQEGWGEFIRQNPDVKTAQVAKSDDLHVEVDEEFCTVTAIGKKTKVEGLMSKCRVTINSIESKLQKKKNLVMETVAVKPHQIIFLKAHKFMHGIKQIYKDMRIDPDIKGQKIVLMGLPGDIVNVKMQMFELLQQMQSETLKPSPKICALLKAKSTREYIVSLFQAKRFIAVYDVSPDVNQVTVYTKTPEELSTAVAIVKSSLVERSVKIPEDSMGLIGTNNWKSLYDQTVNQNPGQIRITVIRENSEVQIVATKQIIDGVLESIQNFLQENTILEKFVNMDLGVARLLLKEAVRDMRKIESDFKSYSVRVKASDSPSKPGVLISGIKDGLTPAVTRVKQLTASIKCCDHSINTPGMRQYFLEGKGREVMSGWQDRYNVAITTGEKGSQTQTDEDSENIKAKIPLGGDKVIYIVQGDLTKYSVDAIVNAANNRMDHAGGVALAIVNKGGGEIQRECTKYINTKGILKKGQVYTSQAGKLPCKKVIHTVGPVWQGGYKNEVSDLYDSVYVALQEASRLRLTTLAIPAISSGVFGFPKSLCCKTILEAVSDFLKKKTTSLKGVHIVDNNTTLVDIFKQEAQKYVAKEASGNHGGIEEPMDTGVAAGDDPFLTQSGDQDQYAAAQTFVSPGYPSRSSAPAMRQSAPFSTALSRPYWRSGGKDSLITQEGITVSLVRGSITSQQTDVIVNTTNPELNLNSGGVSTIILKAAGEGIQQECRMKAPHGVQQGDVVATSGGRLPAKFIYHGSCPDYRGIMSVQESLLVEYTVISIYRDLLRWMRILQQFVVSCLELAHQSHLHSISLPAIGTGGLGYPPGEVAAAMYDGARHFSRKYGGDTTLQRVDFVVYHLDMGTVKVFEDEIDKLKKVRGSSIPSPEQGASSFDPERMTVSAMDHRSMRGSTTNRSSGSSDGTPVYREQGDGSVLQMQHITITLVKGDITKETSDAIVNSTNSELNFGSQVSKAILKAGGSAIANECNRLGRTDSDHLAVTTAGNLRNKHIIHVAGPWNDHSTFMYMSKWKDRIKNVLKRANEYHMKSLSFPALGTGVMGVGPAKMAEAMFETFQEYGQKPSNNIQDIRVVIYEDRMVKTFQSELKKLAEKKKGLRQTVSDAFQSFMSSGPLLGKRQNSVDGDSEWLSKQANGPKPKGNKAEFIKPSEAVSYILTFHIYGFKQNVLNQVTGAIDKLCKEETTRTVIEGDKYQDTLGRLTDNQVQCIMNLESAHSVTITLHRGSKYKKRQLAIEGRHSSVVTVLDNVHSVFRQVDKMEGQKSEAQLLMKQVQWEYQDFSGTFHPYPPSMNRIIEQAYCDNKPNALFSEQHSESGTIKKVCVDFSQMREVDVGVDRFRAGVRVRRVDLNKKDKLPSNWSTPASMDPFSLVDLQPADSVYIKITRKFVSSTHLPISAIKKIQRVQNPSLYQKFLVHKTHMDENNPANTVNERNLWHGTEAKTLSEINTSGFNRSLCGKHGTTYGRGVYFAVDASTAVSQATQVTSGDRCIYYCRVLTGEFTQGDSSYLVPPPKDRIRSNIKYDSVVDSPANPSVYVVFQDTQAYPEYLITFI